MTRLLLGLFLLIATESLAADPFATLMLSRLDAGAQTPTFHLSTIDGTTVDSKQLSGKVVLLNFWATWCGPCKEEMPSFERLRGKFPPEQLLILAVTTDIRPREIKAFWKQLGLRFDVLLDEQEELSERLMIRNLPTTILVDAHGRIQGRGMGPRQWDSPEAIALIRSLLLHP